MFPEEARKIFDLLQKEKGKCILNVCSSDETFYKETQPHIWENLLRPLIENGNKVYNLDIKNGNGVDIVSDCTYMEGIGNNEYDIILFCSGVEHIIDVDKAFSEIKRVLRRDGVVICSAPGVYPKHDDPIDTMLRLPTLEDWVNLMGPEWEIESFKKTKPIPALSEYHFQDLVYATIIKAKIMKSMV